MVLTYRATLVRLAVSNAARTRPVIPTDGVSGYGLTGMRERLALVGGTLVAAEIPDQPYDLGISNFSAGES